MLLPVVTGQYQFSRSSHKATNGAPPILALVAEVWRVIWDCYFRGRVARLRTCNVTHLRTLMAAMGDSGRALHPYPRTFLHDWRSLVGWAEE